MTGAPGQFATSRFRALEHDFAISAHDPILREYLDEILEPMAAEGEPRSWYRIQASDLQPATYSLWFDEELVVDSQRADRPLAMLLWHINRKVVERSTGYVLLHAACACSGDDAVILPAAMESGKTTLVAGLVRAGLRYLTDEVAALAPYGLRLTAYPKPLSIDAGSWPVLPDLRRDVASDVQPYLPNQWLVPPTSIRADAVAQSARARLVVSPRYEEHAPTTLTRLSMADGALLLMQNAHAFALAPQRNLDTFAGLVQHCPVYELRYGDLHDGCQAVSDVLERHRRGRNE